MAILDKNDFNKVFLHSMEKKLNAKVDFFQRFRLSEGISRTNLNKLVYFLKEKVFRRRDIVYGEGDTAEFVYFTKEGEFEVSKRIQTKLSKVPGTQKVNSNMMKNVDIKVSIIGPNQIIGLEDLHKDKTTYRQNKVTCISEKAMVYYLSKDEYFTRFYKNLARHVVNESRQLKEPFFNQRVKSLK